MGYQHGKTVFDVWSRSGVVEKMLKDRHQEEFHNTQNKNVRAKYRYMTDVLFFPFILEKIKFII